MAGVVPWWLTGWQAGATWPASVRNPMYLAVLAVIIGQALLLGRPVLLGYAAAVGAAFTAFVCGCEQPALTRRYGAQYQAYKRPCPAGGPA